MLSVVSIMYTFLHVFLLIFTLIMGARLRINRFCKVPPRSGVCMDVWKCPYYADSLLQSPRPAFLVKAMQENLCGFVNEATPKVCCPKIEKPDLTSHRNFKLLNTDCGRITNNFRIIEGINANPGEFPWMALIAYKTGELPEDEDFRCAGSLINDRYVLTAAHCVDNTTILGVRLGEHNVYTERDCDKRQCQPPVQDLLVREIIPHPEYDPFTFSNDIALLRLSTPANLITGSVQPICLPLTTDFPSKPAGYHVMVAGWGVTETGQKSKVLRKISIPIVSHLDCWNLYKSYKPITQKQLCAGGYKGRDSCAGDSGGPLQSIEMVNSIPQYVQHGIVSWGPSQCGVDGRPAVYTNVKEYSKWILDNIRK